jgi:hypothetical protein
MGVMSADYPLITCLSSCAGQTVRRWLSGQRLSLSEILALAEPETEFRWRQGIEEKVRSDAAHRWAGGQKLT